MTREEMFAEIERLQLDAYDPLFPLGYIYRAEINRLLRILFPKPEPAIQVEEEKEDLGIMFGPEITFEELFGV